MTKFLCGECIHNSDKGGGCLIPNNLGYVDNCNYYLPKDRPIVQTNEEWFCGLSTEEKAEFLNLIIRVGPYENEPKDFWECVYGRGGDRGTKSIVEWLKQPHRS